MPQTKRPIGQILVERGLVKQVDVDKALEIQRNEPKGLTRKLVSILCDGDVLREADGVRALSEQLGVPGIDLTRIVLDLSALSFVPETRAVERRMMPVFAEESQIFLAMADPDDRATIDELEFVTGRKVRTYVAAASLLARATQQAFAASASGSKYYFGPLVGADVRAKLEPLKATREKRRPSAELAAAMTVRELPATNSGEIELLSEWADPDESPSEAPPPPKSESPKKLVLVVEDEHDVRKLLVRLIETRGYETMEADRGPLALERVKERTPDLIVLDAMLPELHGFEIARRLKASDLYKDIPILMLSAVHRGWRIAEDAKSSLRIDEYMEKPFRVADVSRVIDRLLEPKPARELGKRPPDELAREAKELITRSAKAYDGGNTEEACTLLEQAIALDPLAYRPHYHLGLLFARLERPFDAMTELEKAIELHPKSFSALRNLALLYERAGFRNKAVELWERCVQNASDPKLQEDLKAHLLTLLS